jgi:hypothetical protein
MDFGISIQEVHHIPTRPYILPRSLLSVFDIMTRLLKLITL